MHSTRNYTSQFTLTHQCSQSLTISTSHFLVKASNSGVFLASSLTPLLVGRRLTSDSTAPTLFSSHTDFLFQTVLVITSHHGPLRKYRFQQFLYCCGGYVAVATCLFRRRYLVTSLHVTVCKFCCCLRIESLKF
jgi:hypothetical protein